jgi:hypothetical protein
MKILIIGTGQLGSRYIQGLATCSTLLEIWCYDQSKNSLKKSKERWKEVESRCNNHQIHWTQESNELPTKIDLAVIATNADVRLQVLRSILKFCHIRYLVLEKVLVQSASQLYELEQVVKNLDGVWVNTARRVMNWHQRIRTAINNHGSVKVSVGNSNWGLACNAIHFLDLVSWWSDEKLTSIDSSGLEKNWCESKRPGFYEITGLLKATYSGGSELILESRMDGEELLITVQNMEGEWCINELNGIVTGPNGAIISGKIELQSDMTARLVESILKTGSCGLPNFEKSARTHKVFLQSMLEHWNKTQNRNDTIIPIT